MRVIIAGSRTLEDPELVVRAVAESGFEVTSLVSGCARGIDRLAERWAYENFIGISRYPAQWVLHGKRAGRVRNQQMAENADALIAIMVRQGSPGTLDMIDRASALGLKVHIHLVDL